MTRVLVVEDNPDLAFGLQATLEFEGYAVAVAGSGEDGLESSKHWQPDVILLDVMLPGMDGYTVLADLRRAGDRTPVLMLTAKGEERDVLTGFDIGADDYLTKPFSTLELLARVRALLRRTQGSAKTSIHAVERFGTIQVDRRTRGVVRDGTSVALTPKEFDLLLSLIDRRGAVASRTELLDQVWGYSNPDVQTRTVDIHIAELRRKLEVDPSTPRHLLTVRKVGYRLQP